MTDTHATTPPSTRTATRAAGLLYIATFVFSIPALALYSGVVDDPSWVLGSGSDQGVLWGALMETVMALACIGTAVALHPVLTRLGPARAIGFVASRTIEAAMILTGVLAVLAVFTLRQDAAGADPATLTTVAGALVAVKDWTFLLGPGLLPAVNACCFATIVRRHHLVPRWIPSIGLIGVPVLLASTTGTLFGAWDQVSTVAMLAALPIATWELSVGLYMTCKGFRPAATSAASTQVNGVVDTPEGPADKKITPRTVAMS